jgi:cytoskeletal protein CcmA (bactofilin family)
MWGKTIERDQATPVTSQSATGQMQERPPAPAAPVPQKHSAVGKTMRLIGDIYSEEELYLDGEVEGAVDVRNRLTVGPNGKITANIKARELVVRGSIKGNVEADDRIAIMTGASIVGDVKTAGIVIEDGAYFKGGIDILCPEKKSPEPVSKIATMAQAART